MIDSKNWRKQEEYGGHLFRITDDRDESIARYLREHDCDLILKRVRAHDKLIAIATAALGAGLVKAMVDAEGITSS